MLIDDCALTPSALFLGAALYVALCEQPARLALDDRPLLGKFKPSYIVRWGHLHLGRVALGAISTALFLWASTQ